MYHVTLQNGYVLVPADCPTDHKAYVMDRARGSQCQQSQKPVAQQQTKAVPVPRVVSELPSAGPVVGSAPLPVPGRTVGKGNERLSSISPRLQQLNKGESPKSRRSSESSNVDIGSLTPPTTTFAIGTPPNSANYKGMLVCHIGRSLNTF